MKGQSRKHDAAHDRYKTDGERFGPILTWQEVSRYLVSCIAAGPFDGPRHDFVEADSEVDNKLFALAVVHCQELTASLTVTWFADFDGVVAMDARGSVSGVTSEDLSPKVICRA